MRIGQNDAVELLDFMESITRDPSLAPSVLIGALTKPLQEWLDAHIQAKLWTDERDLAYVMGLASIIGTPDNDALHERTVETVLNRVRLAIGWWTPPTAPPSINDPTIASAKEQITALISQLYWRSINVDDAVIMVTATMAWLLAKLGGDKKVLAEDVLAFSNGLRDVLSVLAQ
jgi:hypothetical protein